MLSLTPRQFETLFHLVRGTADNVDRRSLCALERRGLVNRHGIATTAGWHAVDELRYVPYVRVPEDWEIETWRGQVLYVEEHPDHEYDDEGNVRWHIAKTMSLWLDIYKMMKFYQDCKRREAQFVESMWSRSDDFEYENEIKYGWKGGRSHFRDRLVMIAQKDATAEVEREWGIFYSADYYYRWANDLFVMLDIGNMHRHIDCSYKYSLQDNMDEVEKFRAAQPDDIAKAYRYMATVTVA